MAASSIRWRSEVEENAAAAARRCSWRSALSGPQRPPGERLDVEDQRDGAVTEDGRAGVQADRL
jgi:hypothetical protein